MKKYIIPIFVPHLGCPNDCVFCNQKTITGQEKKITAALVKQTIEQYLTTIPPEREKEVAYYGGSFTGIDEVLQKELLRPAECAKERGLIQKIRVSTRPDYIHTQVLQRLLDHGVNTIELGVQSLDERVLCQSKRGHSVSAIEKAVALIRSYPFELGLQLMVGLPGDNEASFLGSVERLLALKPDFVRLYPTIVLADTELAVLYQNKQYQPLSLEQAIAFCKKAYCRFLTAGIPVIRLGLQATEDLNEKTILAGPYHPAFRELVESAILRDLVDEALAKRRQTDDEILQIQVHPSLLSKTIGQKRANIAYWQERYGFLTVQVKGNAEMQANPFQIAISFVNDNFLNKQELLAK